MTVRVILLFVATFAVASAAADSKVLEVEATRLTLKEDCVCRLRFDHATRVTECVATIKFRIESPKEYRGTVVALQLVEAPAVADAFPTLFAHSMFALRLKRADLIGSEKEALEYYFRDIYVRAVSSAEPKRANQALQPTALLGRG